MYSYVRGDGRVVMGESCMRKKGSIFRGVSERELVEVWVLGSG